MHRVFIDGQAGTTGLQIHQRLSVRSDIELIEIDPARRKDADARQEIINKADVVILCLPDDAARETVAGNRNPGARFIDASTAHRTDPSWCYGFPEMVNAQRAKIARATHVANPGCYPTGFLTAVRPLVEEGLLSADTLVSIHAISGYSGGGRQLIERYEARAEAAPDNLWHARPYALSLQHKHVPEMTRYSGLNTAPIFLPLVGHFHRGMLVSVPVHRAQWMKPVTPDDIHRLLCARYEAEPCIRIHPFGDETELDQGFLDPEGANGTNRIDLFVFGHADQMVLVARLDNLGKGAAGAAVQNLNLMLQVNELEGLTTENPDE